MKVFVTRILPAAGIRLMEEAGIEVTQWTEKRNLTPGELIAACRQHDGLLNAGSASIDKSFLNACAHLKVISLYSVGYDRVDVAEANRLNIPVGNTPDVLSAATADIAFLLMIAASRKAFFLHKQILKGEWGFYDPMADLGIQLDGRTLGIWGLGNIGTQMARRCIKAYNMKLIYCNRHNNRKAETELGATKVSFDELLAQSDIISVHTALTDETKGRFNMATFKKMKRNALFINTARGGIHVEEDLIEALNNGVIWGAGLDVTNPEPMRPTNPLLQMPTVAVLPHVGSATIEAREAMAIIAARNVIAAFKGEPLPYAVII